MREAGVTSTVCAGVPAPPEVDMHAPPKVPRNAEGRKVKAALVEDEPVLQYNAANKRSIIKAGARERPAPVGAKARLGRRGGKPQPDYGLPNLTPWRLSVVSVRCSAFKTRFDADRFML
jgi:hypothetical protein